MKLRPACLFMAAALFFQCKNDEKAPSTKGPQSGSEPPLTAANPLLKLVTADQSGLDFENQIVESFENNPTTNVNIYNGGGLAVADVNNDGLPDAYFVNANGPNKLFLNDTKPGGPIHFRDVTAGSGLESPDGFESAVTAVDINADGWMDFYVCAAGPFEPEKCRNKLFVNNHDGSFSEKAREYGLDAETKSTGAAFFDYDLDGDLDMYLVNYPQTFDFTSRIEARLDPRTNKYVANTEPKTALDSDRFYQNDGSGHFTDVSQKAGIHNFAYGLSVAISDLNSDGWPDIYVGNDFIQPDLLYINQRNGTFKDMLGASMKHTSQHTMGVDIADFDNDGLVDFCAADMLPRERSRLKSTMNSNSQTNYNQRVEHGYFEPVVRNMLQKNNGAGPDGLPQFSDVGCMAGIYNTDWSWSALFMDLDNDGLKDLGITNGYRREVNDLDFFNFTLANIVKAPIKSQFAHVEDFLKIIPSYKLRNYLFRNRGDLTFEDMTGQWATVPGSFSSGAAWADFDRDGDLDWIISNLDDKPFLYENQQSGRPGNHFLEIKALGTGQNPQATGATATLELPDGSLQYAELNPVRGIFSSCEPLLHFGLGKNERASKLTVRWPNGRMTVMEDVAANQFLSLKMADATLKSTPPMRPAAFFKNTTAASGVNFEHRENVFDDFDKSFLQPWKISELGPALASGDANGDGLGDFFIGNAFDQPGGLFLRNANGSFRRSSQPVFDVDKIFEDNGALFFDADKDGDQDLLVLSGGHEATNPAAWQPRLFLNDGKGSFSKKADGLPAMQAELQCAAAHDFDGDGDLDLFLGGRLGKNYPEPPKSFVLKNDGGKFTDATAAVAGDFEKCGMVTGLAWANLDSDAAPELVAVGEWMAVSVFKLEGGRLKNATQSFGLEKSTGLWQSLSVGDLDGDGDLDLLTGNFGLNTRLRASEERPLQLFYNDFDGNGSVEPVLAMFEPDGKLYPTARQDVMLKQMPSLKKKFLYARDYASATVADLFAKDKLAAAKSVAAATLASCWWENRGGKFIRHDLPNAAQVAPGLATAIADLTGDGLPDLFVGGNKYGIEVETGRCDASAGCLLAGDGKGNFSAVPNWKSGIRADREARGVVVLKGANGRLTVVVANNNGGAQVFSR